MEKMNKWILEQIKPETLAETEMSKLALAGVPQRIELWPAN